MAEHRWNRITAAVAGLATVAMVVCGMVATARAAELPDPALDAPLAPGHGQDSVVLAGGCFWGMQAVFQHVRGVTRAVAGYAGGAAATAHYEMVSTGTTGHAESVQVTYDPSQVTLGQILKVYFAVAHDPTEVDRQGPDDGTQYRSEIFVHSAAQGKIADAYIAQLQQAKVFPRPIATRVEPLPAFYVAEDHHQNYAQIHPDDPYIVINDLPKVWALKRDLPRLYVASPAAG